MTASINRTTKRCTWVLTPAAPGVNAVYCNASVGYTMPTDEDGYRVRSYDNLCYTHEQARKAQVEEIKRGIASGELDPDDYLYDV